MDGTKFYPMSVAYDNQTGSDSFFSATFFLPGQVLPSITALLFSLPSIKHRPRDNLKTIGQIKGNVNIYHDK